MATMPLPFCSRVSTVKPLGSTARRTPCTNRCAGESPETGAAALGASRVAEGAQAAAASRTSSAAKPLVTRMAGGPREGDHIADVGETGHIGDGALETEPEPRVRHGAVAAQVAVPGVGRGIEAHGHDALVEHLQPLLALRAADDLADAGGEHVHGGHRLVVLVHPHVER